jgi:hypothetical protein
LKKQNNRYFYSLRIGETEQLPAFISPSIKYYAAVSLFFFTFAIGTQLKTQSYGNNATA